MTITEAPSISESPKRKHKPSDKEVERVLCSRAEHELLQKRSVSDPLIQIKLS